MSDYHSHPAISRTGIKCFRKSRRLYHARHVLQLPEAQMEPTPEMNLGSLCHAELLEPGSLEGKYAVLTDWPDFRTKAAQKWRDDHVAAGRMVVKREDIADMVAMVKAVAAVARPWLEHGNAVIEQPIFWTDELTGLDCRCKPDWLIHGTERVISFDYKNTGDASPSTFSHRANDQELWTQDVHYSRGIEAKYGLPVEFYFVVVESKLPYRVGVYQLERATTRGNFAVNEYLDTLAAMKACQQSGNWAEPWEGVVNRIELRERSLHSDALASV